MCNSIIKLSNQAKLISNYNKYSVLHKLLLWKIDSLTHFFFYCDSVFVTSSKTFVEIRVARARASTFCLPHGRRAAIFPRTVALQKKTSPENPVAVDKGVNIINGLSKDPPTY